LNFLPPYYLFHYFKIQPHSKSPDTYKMYPNSLPGI
jgi:hypothetical protein